LEGDDSVTALTESFRAMVEHLTGINEQLQLLEQNEPRDLALGHCAATSEKIHASIIAFQFYDRLQQCLQHVTNSLKGLSGVVESPVRLYNPQEWINCKNKSDLNILMESEKALFDTIVKGKSNEEAAKFTADESTNKKNDEDIELF
jgi:hypothetical protein